ncbi:MAG: hypothetical protein GY822_23705, partial [Deltaproteobacteria bacterium]|nr:hypothetical protein [Deltaproteobacteria bacterium]
MAATTIYDVMIRFGVADKKARRGIRGLGSASDRAYGAMKRLAVLAGAGMGMHALVKHTVGYNAMLQETRDSLTTVIQGLQKISEGSALQKAGDLMENLRGDAKKSAGTFQEMTEFAKAIAPAVLKAGGSIEDLRDMTKGGAVAAAAFGERADVAARDIKDALRRGVNARDPFASQLLA